MTSRKPSRRSVCLIVTFLPLCWLAMMIVHEAGHAVGAWLTGGQVTAVVLHPLQLSQTILEANPSPLFVAWAGPLAGCLIPLGLWLSLSRLRVAECFLARFFAGFCLIANGAYLAIGGLTKIGDSRELLQHGCPLWMLLLFGAVTAPAGFAIWNGQGADFGLGPRAREIRRRSVIIVATLLLIVVIVELLFSGSIE